MAKRNRFKQREDKKRRLKLNLQPNQEAFIGDDGKVEIHSTDLRGRDNFGVVSALGRDLRRLLVGSKPYLEKCDREYLVKESLPLFIDRPEGVCIY
jgi:hypothetical protein